MRWPGMDRSRLGRGELVLYPYIATAGEAPGRAAGGVGFRSGYARPTADPTGQLRVADRPMSLSRERRLRYKLSLRDLAEMFLIRGLVFTHEAVRDWETKLA